MAETPDKKTFGRNEIMFYCVFSLVISIFALGISVVILFTHESRSYNMAKKMNTLDKKSHDFEVRLEKLRLKCHGEMSRRNAPKDEEDSNNVNVQLRQSIDREIKKQVNVFMSNLHKVYCTEKDKMVIVGAKGEPGSRGAHGPRGILGPKGERGQQGIPSVKGEKGSAGISVSAPTISSPPKSLTVHIGHTVFFSCAAQGLPSPAVTWFRMSGNLPSGHHVIYDNGTLVITDVKKGDEGVYACLAKNMLGEAKAFASFNLLLPARFIQKPKNLIAWAGTAAKLDCKAGGYPHPTITWYKGNQTSKGQKLNMHTDSITFPNVLSKDSGIYTCIAQNIINKIEAKAELLVAEDLKFTTRPHARGRGHISETLSFDCQGWSGVVVPDISWTRSNGQSLSEHQILPNGTLILVLTSRKDAGEYTCTVRNPLASIESVVVVEVYLRSCSEWKMSGSTNSGSYVVDPDGPGRGVPEFEVYCNMALRKGAGVTELSHDAEMRTVVQGYTYPGSYLKNINYTQATMRQIEALIRASKNCEQFIMYECRHSALLWHGLAYGWWVSRDGAKMDYWGGAIPGSWKCACGMTNSCHGGRGCNCDANDGEWREDSGLLVDKSRLPVSQLRFGDTGDPRSEKGFHTLGEFKCYGIA